MRIGIYLGRHQGRGGGSGVYARTVAIQSIAALSRDESSDYELVFYGDAIILDQQFLERISLRPELSEVADSFFDRGADGYFRSLPNGARVRILVRKLPAYFGSAISTITDQFLLPLLLGRDKIELLHSIGGTGLLYLGSLTRRRPLQLVSVDPGLLNAECGVPARAGTRQTEIARTESAQTGSAPVRTARSAASAANNPSAQRTLLQQGPGSSAPPNPADSTDKPASAAAAIGSAQNNVAESANISADQPGWEPERAAGFFERVRRLIFRLQFGPRRSIDHLAVPSRTAAEELYRRFGFAPEKTSPIPPGIDEFFQFFIRQNRLNGAVIPLHDRSRPEGKASAAQAAAKSERGERRYDLLTELDRVFRIEPGYTLFYGNASRSFSAEAALAAWISAARVEKGGGLVLVLADDRLRRNLARQIEKLEQSAAGYGGLVRVLPWVEREDVPLLSAGAAVILSPSAGTGQALLEAFSLGVPVVSPRLEQAETEIARHPGLFFECRSSDFASVCSALSRAFSAHYQTVESLSSTQQPALRQNIPLIHRGDGAVRSSENVVKEHFDLYRRLSLQGSGVSAGRGWR